MEYKKTIILLALVVFLLSIAGVSASEIDNTISSENANTIELSTDNDIKDNLQTSEENEALASTDYDEAIAQTDTEVLGEGSAKYSDLAEEIRHSGNITLTHKNYTYDKGETITISEANKVIDGNGAVIDMNGSTIRAFNVTASGVTIKNLTIKNAKYSGNYGGAIYFTSSATSGTVSNCNFTNNIAEYGGSVYFNGTGEVTNCNFTNNSARYGGAISMDSGTVTNCNFTNNSARYGGAINMDSGTVTKCNFTNNKATGEYSEGGAIWMYSGSVSNCNFTNNKATGEYSEGSAIFLNTGTVTNCNFTNNKATGDYARGGAVYFFNNSTVTNCNFTNNTATRDGGAVYFNGEGNVTNCNFTGNTVTGDGGAVYFRGTCNVTNCNFTNNSASEYGGAIRMVSGNVTNCNFTGNKATGDYGRGGAVYFSSTGNVTNCNFTNNSASEWGGAIYMYSGSVENCNFTDNEAYYGGAVFFNDYGNVTNCNFTNNSASSQGGAIRFSGTGTVTNCNFTNNSASSQGGAIRFSGTGTVTNCNFTDNSANEGGAIYSLKWYTTADTCIFKKNSGEDVNIVIYPPALNANNFTTFYGSGDKLTFDLRTNLTSIPVTNGNISIRVYFKNNDSWIGNYSCLSGEGWIPNLPVGSYYAIFDTEYEKFQPINRTITITIPNVKYYINVTSLATNNKTVNITAKTNVPKDILWDGKLLFILPKGKNITANYAGNGTWWAVHTFEDYAIYQVNATYVGLDNVTINNATISISKTPTNITVENATVDLLVRNSVATGATLTPADAGNLTFTSSNSSVAKVEDGKIMAVGEGTAIITVSFAGSDDYAAAENKTITVNVIKYDSKVTISPIADVVYGNTVTIKYSVENKTNVTVTIDGVSSDKITITDDTITVTGLDAGKYTIDVINNESSLYHGSNAAQTFNVDKQTTSIAADAIATTYNINKDLVITLKDGKGKALSGVKVTVDLNGAKTYTTDNNGQVKVSTKGLAPKAYTAKLSFKGNTNYAKSTKDVKVKIKKATPKLTAKNKTFKTTIKTMKYTIVLKDNTGKAIKKAKVTLKVKGKTYKSTTNSKGKATFKISKLNKKGNFKAIVTYKGSKYYSKVTKKTTIKVRGKITAKLTVKSKTFKTNVKTKKYTVILKNNVGKAIKKAKLTLKVNGKTYKAITNTKGKATFKITKLTNKGKYKATITYKGNKNYKKLNKKSTIKVILAFKTVSKGSKDKETVKKIQIALKNNGYYLTYQGHYLMIDGKYQGCTVRSVNEFQHDKGLKTTGKVDEKTAKQLGII